MIEQAIGRFLVLGPVALLALVLSLALMVLLQPWLARYAMARPNARSSHQQPTPQGGGIAVMAATIVISAIAVMVVLDAAADFCALCFLVAQVRR